jgi:hypothetical protein
METSRNYWSNLKVLNNLLKGRRQSCHFNAALQPQEMGLGFGTTDKQPQVLET